jgi:hypothetical protein
MIYRDTRMEGFIADSWLQGARGGKADLIH